MGQLGHERVEKLHMILVLVDLCSLGKLLLVDTALKWRRTSS